MNINENTIVGGLWFKGARDKDFLATVTQEPGEAWKGEYRYRYYADEKAYDSEDEKNFYVVIFDENLELEEVVRIFSGLVEMVAEVWFGGTGSEIVISDYMTGPKDASEFTQWMGFRDWANVQVKGFQETQLFGGSNGKSDKN